MISIKGKRSICYHIPKLINKKNWGGFNFRVVLSCFNERGGNLVLSFPADASITVYNLRSGKTEYHHAASTFFGEIKPLSHSKDGKIDWEVIYKHFATQPSYSSIIYDRYRNVYYRTADIPINEDKYDQNNIEGWVKPFSIMVLDSEFNLIGEALLPHLSYSRTEFFVSKEGLNMKKNHEDDEDLLVFSAFLPKSIGNQD